MKNKEYSPKYDLEITTFTSRFIKRLASKLYYHYYLFMAKPTTKDTQRYQIYGALKLRGKRKKWAHLNKPLSCLTASILEASSLRFDTCFCFIPT